MVAVVAAGEMTALTVLATGMVPCEAEAMGCAWRWHSSVALGPQGGGGWSVGVDSGGGERRWRWGVGAVGATAVAALAVARHYC